MTVERTMGVYVCTGCSIGERLDADRLAEEARAESSLTAGVHPPLCLPEAVEALRRAIGEQGVQTAVVAACSPRVNWDVFAPESLDVDAVERVNLRELVAWSKPPNDDETQALAADYLRIGIARARHTQPPAPSPGPVETTILVVGGGVTGIAAALESAGAGHDVVLVEKEAALGGWASRWRGLFPTRFPYQDVEQPDIASRVRAVEEHPRIRVLTKTEVREIAGMPGDFTVTIRRGDDHSTVRVGAIVVASGWQPADQAGQAHLGLGESADVVTSVMLEQMAREGPLVRPSDGRAVASVAFVQRPRPREEHRSPFGPEVIDLVSLKQALYVRERNRAADVYILCEDIVTPGHYEDFYRRVQQEPRVFFIKGEVTAVTEDEGGELRVVVERSSLGEQLQVPVDLVVLATEMVPAGTDWLNLRYMRGPGLPTEASGFTTSNFICFPYESQRTGIYVAGGAREPMDIPRSLEDAAGAALKAVQSVALAARGGAAHPRSGDLSLPHTRRADCTKCGRCPQECPFSAIELDEDGFPVLQPNRCRRCGICMGACPVQAISFENYSVGQLSAMIKAIRPPADQSQLRILALVCENDAYPAFDAAGVQRLTSDNSVRVIPLRCLGSLNTILIADALSHGIDGIMLMGCKTGDDYQCHFIRGSELATTRMENVQETLQRLLLEPERVQTMEVEIADHHRIPQIVEEFVAGIRRVGPNPFRGF